MKYDELVILLIKNKRIYIKTKNSRVALIAILFILISTATVRWFRLIFISNRLCYLQLHF